MSSHDSGPSFLHRPDLKPRFVRDPDKRRPFIGFRFLDGLVVLGHGADKYSDRHLRCVTHAALGASNSDILRVITTVEPNSGMGTISYGMGKAYNELGIPKRHNIQRRSMLMAALLGNNVFQIVKPGVASRLEIPEEYHEYYVGIGRGFTEEQIGKRVGRTSNQVRLVLEEFADDVQIYNRDVIVTAGLITTQIRLDEVWPPPEVHTT